MMISIPLAYIGFIWFDLPKDRRDDARAEARRPDPFDRIIAALFRWRRQQAPPADHLSNHLRRDIGLPPVDRRKDWLWYR
jgi:hypothetical protein